MSVYEETGTAYLTRIKDLNLSCESHANYRGYEVMSLRQQSGTVYLRSKQRFTYARKVLARPYSQSRLLERPFTGFF
jgi:hypothetical protein